MRQRQAASDLLCVPGLFVPAVDKHGVDNSNLRIMSRFFRALGDAVVEAKSLEFRKTIR
jgi:hypothetical protein